MSRSVIVSIEWILDLLQTTFPAITTAGNTAVYWHCEVWTSHRYTYTVESPISGQARDSISTVAPQWSVELSNRVEGSNTVQIESRDYPDMGDYTDSCFKAVLISLVKLTQSVVIQQKSSDLR